MAKFVELRPGEVVRIGQNTMVTLEHKSGQRARLRIDSGETVSHLKAVGPEHEQEKTENVPRLFKSA